LVGTIQSFTYSYSPIATGQTTVYEVGDNGTHQTGVARSYTDNGDGTVTDNYSGLVWQKCSVGQNNDSSCSGTATGMNWQDAGNYCSSSSLAGKSWRLPTVNELVDLVDYGKYNPAIDTIFMSGLINHSVYWSSNTFLPFPDFAFSPHSESGYLNGTEKRSEAFFRCVSGIASTYQIFVDNLNGTVIDKKTGLTWQKCSAGLNNDATCTGTATNHQWVDSINYCSVLTLAGKTWRLANVNELRSLIDFEQTSSISINNIFFPNTHLYSYYWSTSSILDYPTQHWSVNFQFGGNLGIHIPHSSANTAVRCVSGP